MDEINTKINELKYSTGDSGCYITVTTTRYDNDDTTYGDVQYTINGKWTSGETFTLTTCQEEMKSDLGVRIWLFFEDYETVDYYLQWSNDSDGTYATYTEPDGYWLIHCIEMTDPTNSTTETIEADTTYLTTTDVDAALSTTSENPVQNKVITEAINEIQDNAFSTSGISTLNTTDKSSLVSAINEVAENSHTHSNKAALDMWDSAGSNLYTDALVSFTSTSGIKVEGGISFTDVQVTLTGSDVVKLLALIN